MQKFETSDASEILRFKRSQFFDKIIEFPAVCATGVVHSVVEVKNSVPTTWLVTFTPKSLPMDVPTKKLRARR
jgi:hypothetical protein